MKKHHNYFLSIPYGFAWGAVEVVRVCSDKKYGNTLFVQTETERLEIRITLGGKLRVGKVTKPSKKLAVVGS